MSVIPSFEDAIVDFKRFLRGKNLPGDVHWIFRDDVIKLPALAVRVPLPARNSDLARDVYERGRARGLGVAMFAVCRVGDRVGAIVETPSDHKDAESRMFPADRLKLSIAVDLPAAIEIRNRLEWKLRTLVHPRWDLIPPRPTSSLAAARVV